MGAQKQHGERRHIADSVYSVLSKRPLNAQFVPVKDVVGGHITARDTLCAPVYGKHGIFCKDSLLTIQFDA